MSANENLILNYPSNKDFFFHSEVALFHASLYKLCLRILKRDAVMSGCLTHQGDVQNCNEVELQG